jgi:hypothetical protein
MRPAEQHRYLPLYARCALEILDTQADRSIAKLNGYLSHYAAAMATDIDEHARFSAHAIALLRFSPETLDATGSVAVWPAAVQPTLANAVYRKPT